MRLLVRLFGCALLGKTVVVDVTIDDPGAYTKPFETRVNLRPSAVPFMQSPWNCSVRDNDAFTRTLLSDAVPK